MPEFAIRNAYVLAYASGFTMWLYRAASIEDFRAPGFFDRASDMFNPGDHVIVSAPDGSAQIVVTISGLATVAIHELYAVRFNAEATK